MTVNHDHATLFVAPSAPPAVQAIAAAGRPEPAVNSGADAMRRLLDPFAVLQPTQPVRKRQATPPSHRI